MVKINREEFEKVLSESRIDKYSLEQDVRGKSNIFLGRYNGVNIGKFDSNTNTITLVYWPHEKGLSVLSHVLELREHLNARGIEYSETPAREEVAEIVKSRYQKEGKDSSELVKRILGNS